jgi:DNA-binding Lrp family transcriptional regulator
MSSVIGISKRKVEDNIAKLRELGILKRIGGTRGYWDIVKQ